MKQYDYSMSMSQRERITVTIDPAVLQRIDAISQAREESRSATIERILRNGAQDEEEMLETIGKGIQGQVMAVLLNNPQILNAMSKLVGDQLTDDDLARLQDGGPGVIEAGKRYRSTQQSKTKKGKSVE
tara:strand:- start:2588 stop:2974 length:387 start_codon:yes stop_codon:yes gene_type:complete